MARKGVKVGIARVEAISGPLDGILISDRVVAAGANSWINLVPASRQIESVIVKALATNTGMVWVTGNEANTDGFELDAGESVSIGIDDLFKVKVYVATASDGMTWLAIERARD